MPSLVSCQMVRAEGWARLLHHMAEQSAGPGHHGQSATGLQRDPDLQEQRGDGTGGVDGEVTATPVGVHLAAQPPQQVDVAAGDPVLLGHLEVG
ncbi:hypothetical protein SHIRM173S_04481 [Streptomyces hirsutus]